VRKAGFNWRLLGGTVAPVLFVTTFTALGMRRRGYDWRRDAVSSLAVPPGGAPQRVNFIATGLLFAAGARELGRRSLVPRAATWLIGAAGVGLVGSGIWVTDEVAGRAASTISEGPTPTRAGRLHNLSALPIFAGLPTAALVSAVAAARRRAWGWSAASAATTLLMPGWFVCFGAAHAPASVLAGKGGIYQRLSIVTGFGWVGAACLRGLRASARSAPRA
jgi:hypothetical protein